MLTRVTVMAVSLSVTADALVVWRQISSIGLTGPAKKAPVVGNAKVRGTPRPSCATGVTEKMPTELATCIQQVAEPDPDRVAWALATKKPLEAGVIAATTMAV